MDAQQVHGVEALKRSLNEASKQVQNWPPAKCESADATVDSKRLASYYESVDQTSRDKKA